MVGGPRGEALATRGAAHPQEDGILLIDGGPGSVLTIKVDEL